MCNSPSPRRTFRFVLLLAVTLPIAVGCGPKNVRWNYGPDGQRLLGGARRVTVLSDPEIRTLTDAVAEELRFHGYTVVAPGHAAGSGQPAIAADLVFELSARYVREPVAQTRVKVWPWVSVKVAYGTPKEYYILVSEAKLDLKTPDGARVLGSVVAYYDKPQEDLLKIAKKLGEGLEQIRKGKPSKVD